MRPLSGEIPVPEEKGKDAPMAPRKRDRESSDRPVSLKILADYLGLCPATVSVVLNNVPGRSIPQETRERVRAAARKFNYQPSLLARSLRKRRTFTVGVLVPELSDGYHTLVMSGIGDHLMREGYFYFSAHHRHKPDLVDEYPRLLMGAEVEVALAHQVVADAAHHQSVIAVAKLGHEHSHGEGAAFTKRARQEARLIIELARRGANSFAGFLRDGAARHIVQNDGNGGGAESEIIGQNFQTDGPIGGFAVTFAGRHGSVLAFLFRYWDLAREWPHLE